ncbi:MAG: hypothetical protein KC466_17605, partial [Myxococcales bacterium]|nr:hypothetical protein [Myxococcales bacterium]
MRIHIDHLIQYEYERPVFHEPLILRLRPRADGAQRLERFELEIDPRPVGRSELTDLDGISSTVVWFEELHRTLSIRGRSDVTTLRANPFDFFITDPDAVRLPVQYPPILAGAL